jgi:cell division septation protein DedD
MTPGRVALGAVIVLVLCGAAFAGGYVAGGAGRGGVVLASAPPLTFTDPLARLDDVASSARPTVDLAPAPAAAPANEAPASTPPSADAPLEEMRALERRVDEMKRRVAPALPASPAAKPSRPSVPSHKSAKPSVTDGELSAAMEKPAPEVRAVVELADGSGRAKAGTLSTEGPSPAAKAPKPASAAKGPQKAKAKPIARAKPKAARAASANARFTLQVRAYPDKDKDKAEELVEHLKQRGFEAYLASADVEGRGTWFRVRVGRFGSRDEAEAFRTRLQKEESTPAFVTFVR